MTKKQMSRKNVYSVFIYILIISEKYLIQLIYNCQINKIKVLLELIIVFIRH